MHYAELLREKGQKWGQNCTTHCQTEPLWQNWCDYVQDTVDYHKPLPTQIQDQELAIL